jgi:hypothetical protein
MESGKQSRGSRIAFVAAGLLLVAGATFVALGDLRATRRETPASVAAPIDAFLEHTAAKRP